jgi:hypothetical protein
LKAVLPSRVAACFIASLNNIHCGQMKATGMPGLLARVSWQEFTKDVQLPPQVLVAFPVTHPSPWVANAFPHCRGGGRVVQAMLVPPVVVTPPVATPPDPVAPPFEAPLPPEPPEPELLPPTGLLPPEEPGVELPPTAVTPPLPVAPPWEPLPPEEAGVESPPEATVPPLALLLDPPLLFGCVPPVGLLVLLVVPAAAVVPPAAPAAAVVPPALLPAAPEVVPPDPAEFCWAGHPVVIAAA